MKKALVLRLDSRMAVILNCLVGTAGEFASGEVESGVECISTLNRLRDEYPNEVQRLRDSISGILAVIQPEIFVEMGLQVMSPNELRAAVQKKEL